MFVVTGTPRSATGYASLLFSAMGIPCTHEQTFRPHASLLEVLEWYGQGGDRGESSWLAWVFLGMLPGPVSVLHIVRNPWAVLDSLTHRNDILSCETDLKGKRHQYREMVAAYCPKVMAWDSTINRATAFVIDWSVQIEKKAYQCGVPLRTLCVEDIRPETISEVLDWLGIYRDSATIQAAYDEVPHNVNGGKRIEYDLEVTQPIIKAALEQIAPGQPPVLARLIRSDIPRTPDELERDMDSTLREKLYGLAVRYGYSRDETQRRVAAQDGVMNDATKQQCAAV